MSNYLELNYKKILVSIIILIVVLPIIGVLINAIFSGGVYVGTFIRHIWESKLC